MPHEYLRGGEEKKGRKGIGEPCGNDKQCISNKCMPVGRPTDRGMPVDRPTDRGMPVDRPTDRGGQEHRGKRTCQVSCGANTLFCDRDKCPVCGPFDFKQKLYSHLFITRPI